MRIALIHGFNVSDGGRRSLGKVAQWLRHFGHETVFMDYGWVGPVRVRLRNMSVVDDLVKLQPQATIAHSNGNVIVHSALQEGLTLRAHVAYQPAMRQDAEWPSTVQRVLVLYNPYDRAVRLGRVYRWVNPVSWIAPHPWGIAGATGFTREDARLTQWNTAEAEPPGRGHSYLHSSEHARIWADRINWWLINAHESLEA